MPRSIFLPFLFLFTQIFAQSPNRDVVLDPAFAPFYHGVESGDPLPDKIILWTRVTPDTITNADIDVQWQIATDVSFTNVINYGHALAKESADYTVKIDACGLQPVTFYYYIFRTLGSNSVTGRFKTAPAAGADNDSVRFAVVSCASWEHGFFNAYESISNRNDVDAVVCLGDYIYEYATGDFSGNVSGREYDPPTEAITQLGYRLRYSQYKLDAQLRRIHQLFPFITVWDDHETANDSYRDGAQNHDASEGLFSDRKRNSTGTYFEWMPIRKPDVNDSIRIFRKLRYGKLLDLIMLDTRLYDRDEQDLGATNDATRHMMGPLERAWFLAQLSDTTTRWKIIGNQVMFAPLEVFGLPVNADQWDGYNWERQQIENHIINTPVNDVVILTGDIHTSWCNDIPGPNYDNNSGVGSLAVEFVGPSVTSFNSPLPVGQGVIMGLNQHMKYINIDDNGYYILDVKKPRTQADYTFQSTVTQPTATDEVGPSYFTAHLQPHLQLAAGPILAPQIAVANPPLLPDQIIAITSIGNIFITIEENEQASVPVIANPNICPAVSFTIVENGTHGTALTLGGLNIIYQPQTNYSGGDTVMAIVCADDSSYCDTVYLYITITAVNDIDTFIINMLPGAVASDCFQFDDLLSAATSTTVTTAQFGTLQLNDTCITYTSDSPVCANDTVKVIGCDANGCDTVVYIFRINPIAFSDTVELTLNRNSNITYCAQFDDLLCIQGSISLLQNPQHGTPTLLSDSCVKYAPFYNYVGDDVLSITACDTCSPQNCDTILLLLHTVEPSALNDTRNMIVFGMYPNPAAETLTLQYYLHNSAAVVVSVLNEIGELVKQHQGQVADGLQHLQLNLQQLPAGNYVLQLQSGSNNWSKKFVVY